MWVALSFWLSLVQDSDKEGHECRTGQVAGGGRQREGVGRECQHQHGRIHSGGDGPAEAQGGGIN